MKVTTCKVLTIGELELKERFTHSFETGALIVLWNDELICWYEKRTNTKLKEIRGKVISCKRTFIITQADKVAVYSLDGYEIIPFGKYNYADENIFAILVYKDGKYGACSYTGEEIVPVIYSRLGFDEYGISLKQGIIRKGLYSYTGKVIVPDEYNVCSIKDNNILCSDGKGRFGIYSCEGDVIVPMEYDSIKELRRCILVEKDGKCGMLSKSGDVLLPAKYYDISEVSEGYDEFFIVQQEECCGKGLYKYNGKEILPLVYEEIFLSSYLYVIVVKDGYCGLYNLKGLELLKPIYNNIVDDDRNEFSGIFEVITAGSHFYYIAEFNRVVYADDVKCFNDSYIALKDDVWTLIE